MNPQYTTHAAQFFTATIYEWQTVLADDSRKDIIIDSLQYLVNDKRIELNARWSETRGGLSMFEMFLNL